MQRIILLRSAISTAQVLVTYARVKPTIIHDPSTVNECVKEALRLLHMPDDDLLRVRHRLHCTFKAAWGLAAALGWISQRITPAASSCARRSCEHMLSESSTLVQNMLHPHWKLLSVLACRVFSFECLAPGELIM